MQNNARRDHYLHAMGVVQWRERRKTSVPSIPCYSYQLKRANEQYAWVLADATDDPKEVELLHAISRAMQCEATGARQDYPPSQEELVSHAKRVLLFGERVAQTLALDAADIAMMQTHALADLINTPALKAETWRDLQALMANT